MEIVKFKIFADAKFLQSITLNHSSKSSQKRENTIKTISSLDAETSLAASVAVATVLSVAPAQAIQLSGSMGLSGKLHIPGVVNTTNFFPCLTGAFNFNGTTLALGQLSGDRTGNSSTYQMTLATKTVPPLTINCSKAPGRKRKRQKSA